MITDRDKKIIEFIYKMGFTNISIIDNMFFSNCKYGYDIARKRLGKIYSTGNYLKRFQNEETNEVIYVPLESKIRKISLHNMKVLEYICNIINLGCKLIDFELEPTFDTIKPDAYMSFQFDGNLYFQLLEVEMRHDFVDLNRYNKEYVINSVLVRTNDVLPTLIIVQNTNKYYSKINKSPFDIKQLDLKMKDISKVLIV